MKIKHFLVLVLMLCITTTFAFNMQNSLESSTIVEWLTPFIVLAGTAIARYIIPKVPGWATMIIVSGLSAAVAWVTNVDGSDMSFIMQTVYGLLAVFINQIYRQFTGGNSAHPA